MPVIDDTICSCASSNFRIIISFSYKKVSPLLGNCTFNSAEYNGKLDELTSRFTLLTIS